MSRKISFLVAAHNEEKIIAKTLQNLLELPYENYEVLLGLDGCTDRTEDIVKEFCKKSRKFRHFKLNLRQGKTAVVNNIIKHAKGEIVIINDADWLFTAKNKESLKRFLSVFDDKEIGSIAESFPVEWQEDKIKKGNLGYKMVAYSSYFWLEFQKKNFTYKKSRNSNLLYLKEPTMFLTNIFRKKLYKESFSLGDDFERTQDIVDAGCKIVIFDDISMPRMKCIYDKIYLRDLFRQKKRTAIARRQIKGEQKVNTGNYYLSALQYMIRESWKRSIGVGMIVLLWIFLTLAATALSSFKKPDTRKGWALRARK